MSKFFRSGDASSSSSDGDNDPDETTNESHQTHASELASSLALPPLNELSVSAPASASQGFHKDILLHALLEERCMNDVLKERGQRRGKGSNDSSMEAEARARYRQLVARLAPNDLISYGFEIDSLSPTRQQYRDGLDYLSRTTPTPGHPSVPPTLRRLLTDGHTTTSTATNNQLIDVNSGATALTPLHPVLEPSRYLRDFEELGLLGKGGYGIVYHVKHRLDSIDYAVKKIPISASRMARIRMHGQRELDELLRELRTLARLDHANIVRYFGGWIEWSDLGTFPQRTSRVAPDEMAVDYSLSALGDAETAAAADVSEASLRQVFMQSDNDAGIVFEQSLSNASNPAGNAAAPSMPDMTASTDDSHFLSGQKLALALHLQMGLYPLNLADFISPPASRKATEVTPLKHCFHLQPSISILVALLDGVEYLHSEGIVHRDIKPANIFLVANSKPSSARGSVDLFLCSACRSVGQAQRITLEVRIGDFGLVTAISHPELGSANSGPPVGTALYHPSAGVMGYASPRLDIYALGVIAVELLWPFSTRMERHDTLQRLKQGNFPIDFGEKFSKGGMERCIRDMLSLEDEGIGIAELRKRLVAIAEAEGTANM